MIKFKVYESLQKERKMIFKILKPVNGVAINISKYPFQMTSDGSITFWTRVVPVNDWPDFVTGWPRWTRAE